MQLRADAYFIGAQQGGDKLGPKELAVWVSTADEREKMITEKDLEVASLCSCPQKENMPSSSIFLP